MKTYSNARLLNNFFILCIQVEYLTKKSHNLVIKIEKLKKVKISF